MVGILFVSGGVLDTLNLYWFYLMFKLRLSYYNYCSIYTVRVYFYCCITLHQIVISSTPDIKPIMEKKRIDFKIATEQFQQKMVSHYTVPFSLTNSTLGLDEK